MSKVQLTRTVKPNLYNEIQDDIGINGEEKISLNTKDNMDAQEEKKELTARELLERISLKEKAAKEKKQKKDAVSFNFGIIGLGHAGSKLAEQWMKLGYNAIVINTATQDLAGINIPENNKLFMNIGIQGAAKDLSRGFEAAEQYSLQIQSLIQQELLDSDIIMMCSSLSGGSGAGSLNTVIDMLQSFGKPIIVIGILPMVSEDAKAKANTLETLSKLSDSIKSGKIHNLICVDNARIEAIYEGVSQMDFYRVANLAIVEPLHILNRFSMEPSDVKPLDSAELGTILLNGEGLSIYGQIIVNNYKEDIAVAEAVFSSLEGNLLAGGFNLKEAKFVGFMAIANKNVWKDVPAGAINYASTMIDETFGNPGSYKGIYMSDDEEDVLKIYTFVSGLGLPSARIDGLKKDVSIQQAKIKEKDENRVKKLNLDTGKDTAISDVDKIKNRIAAKTKGFGKLNTVIDRRK